jgi:prolyl oligopeptidase
MTTPHRTSRSFPPPLSSLSLAALASISLAACSSAPNTEHATARPPSPPTMYPTAPTSDTVDTYHGREIADPYRPLEDPDAPATRAWIEAQNRLTRAAIDRVPSRGAIEKRMTELWNFERFGVPQAQAGRWFYTRNDGLQNQSVLYVTEDLASPGRVLLDPNRLAADGTVALTQLAPSEDGTLVAYGLSEAGSDWTTLRVRDVASGADREDKVEWVKFSGLAWSHDGRGFYYSTYPDHDRTGRVALANQRLMFHRLGSAQAEDELVYARPDQPKWGFGATVSDDGELLVIQIWEGTEPNNRVYVRDLRAPGAEVVRLLDDSDAEYHFLAKRGSELFFQTDLEAPRRRVIAVDLTAPARERWRTIVPEGQDTLESAVAAGGKLVASYLQDAHSVVRVFELAGPAAGSLVETLALPGIGSVDGLSGEIDEREAFFSFSGFTQPAAIWRYDVASRSLSTWRAPKLAFDPARYVTSQHFYASKDGTRIPLFLVRREDVALTPETPVLLYGYGGFDIPMKPAYSTANLVWVERGGVYAVACLRGGGEYGREWHEAGTKERKQNVFDDFIAAAEWLVAKKWTRPGRLAIRGGSNGGLLVGACITQRPELFGAALPAVGVLDMLRFHKFTIGWGWASDYGSAEDKTAFEYLLRYSPLHNVRAGTCYPPTLITTGDHDDRVVPAHSFKFAAALQAAQGCANPVLIRIETRGGHGAGKPTAMQIEELADQWAFLEDALGLER